MEEKNGKQLLEVWSSGKCLWCLRTLEWRWEGTKRKCERIRKDLFSAKEVVEEIEKINSTI